MEFATKVFVRCPWVLLLGIVACSGAVEGAAGPGEGPIDPNDPNYCQAPIPGSVTMRRLNRMEYNNTVRDLLGDTTAPADSFPEDPKSGDGFTNNGAFLSTGPTLAEMYSTSAATLVETALADPDRRAKLIPCEPGEACAKSSLTAFANRAWRRPVEEQELTGLHRVYDLTIEDGGTFDEAVALGMRAVLMSPHFLFRPETTSNTPAPLTDHELASRLSYFLWSSMPDDELMALAAEGALSDTDTLRAQVDRMLADPKATGFYEGFFMYWLHVDEVRFSEPAPSIFPTFDDELRTSMMSETANFARAVVEDRLPIEALLTANFTVVDERLAAHYGMEEGNAGRMEFADGTRGGILTLSGILTATSHPDATSPVKRGKWILEQLLCSPPPDPPPNVEAIIEKGGSEAKTQRERLEQHRADPDCAGCHSVMDPLGFALENYDATGAWRDTEDGEPINTEGELPNGTVVTGARDLSETLASDPRYSACTTKKLMAYSLGRALTDYDRCYVDAITESVQEQNKDFHGLIVDIITSDVFRTSGGLQ
ncbi:MAG: DUF1592 domain-containing protein [Myxococcales bacterium]|nr:DUF1592 domain-containing protein [Myxococcales bacterium]